MLPRPDLRRLARRAAPAWGVACMLAALTGGRAAAQDATVSNTTELQAAIANGSVVTIQMNAGTYTLSSPLSLDGVTKQITGSGAVVIDGNDATRLFSLNNSAVLVLDGVTLQRGSVGGNADGGAVRVRNQSSLTLRNAIVRDNYANDNGGALFVQSNGSSLVVEDTRFEDNEAGDNGGAIQAQNSTTVQLTRVVFDGNVSGARGGALFTGGSAQVTAEVVTFSGNAANGSGDGGAIFQGGNGTSISLTNVTISGNTAGDGAGGAFLRNGSTLLHVTVTGNSAGSDGGGLEAGNGGFSLQNSIVFGNTSGSAPTDLMGSFTSNGGNVLGACDSCTPTGNDTTTDPNLSPLFANGGFTETHAIDGTSSAVDIGQSLGSASDQAGRARPQGAAPDAGAYEATPVVTYSVTPDGLGSPAQLTAGTERSQPFTVSHDGGTSETVDLLASVPSGTVVQIDSITGSGFSSTTQAPDDSVRVAVAPSTPVAATVWFTVPVGAPGAQETLTLLARRAGDAATSDDGFAEVERSCGSSSASVSTMGQLRDAVADPCVSSISISPGTYDLTSSGSGALVIDRALSISNTGGGRVVLDAASASRVFELGASANVTMSGLTVTGGSSGGGRGGGIWVDGGVLDFSSGTISGNYADNDDPTESDGGGIASGPGSSVTLINTTISGNISDDRGAAGDLEGTSLLRHVTVVGNTANGNVEATAGGAFNARSGTITLENVLIADNTPTQLLVLNGSYSYLGTNIVKDCQANCGTALTTDPAVGPLFDNGGDSWTHAIGSGSPALDVASGTVAAVDQRGVARPQGSGADLGSYEAQLDPDVEVTPDGLGSPVDRSAGTGYSETFTITNASPGAETIDLSVAIAPEGTPFLTVDSIVGSGFGGAGSTTTTPSIPAGGNVTADVFYTVASGGPGVVDTLVVTGAVTSAPSFTDTGRAEVQRVCGSGSVSVSTMAELRAAVGDSCVSSITIQPGTYDLSSSGSGEMLLDRDLTFANAGGGAVVLDGAGASRIFQVAAGATVSMTGLTVTNGAEGSGPRGAGIYVLGDLTFDDGAILDNVSQNDGGGIATGPGAVLSMTNVTIAGNTTTDRGPGGDFEGTVTLTHVTVAGNSATGIAGGFNVRSGTTTIRNVIVADNTQSGTDQIVVASGSLVEAGANLVEGGCSACSGVITSDPQLEPRGNNGGDSETFALATGSPAIDAGAALGIPTDQRGQPRPQGAAPDLGAYESAPGPSVAVTPDGLGTPVDRAAGSGYSETFTVTNGSPTAETVDLTVAVAPEGGTPFLTVDSIVGSGFGGAGASTTTTSIPAGGNVTADVFYSVSLGSPGVVDTLVVTGAVSSAPGVTDTGRAEVQRICGSGTVVVSDVAELRAAVANSCVSTIQLTAGSYDLTSSGSGALVIDRDLDFENTGAGEVLLDASGASRVFEIGPGVTVNMSDLEITGGYDAVDGGGIYNQGTLSLTRMLFVDNTVGDDGAGFYNDGGAVTVVNSTFSENIASDDGGAFEAAGGTVSLLQVSLIGNQAGASTEETGGAFKVSGSATVTVTNSLISDNITSGGNEPEPIDVDAGTVTLVGDNLIEGGCSGCSGATGAIIDAEPFLQPLANNGGLTRTHGIASNSPAIDAGSNQGVSTDQRGVDRSAEGTGFDLGAFERQVSLAVDVTPDGLGTGNEVEREAGSGYTQDFTVSHSSGGARDIDLIATELGPTLGTTFLNVTGISGTNVSGAGDSARIAGLADGVPATITVTYDVLASGSPAQIDTLSLQARLVDAPTVVDFGSAEVEWVCPAGGGASVSTMAALRAAVANECVSQITLTPGTYDLTSSGSGPLVLDRDVDLLNAGGGAVVIDGGGASRVFEVESGTTVSMTGLTVTGGDAIGEDRNQRGGGIVVDGALTFTSGAITGSTADDGAALALTAGGSLVMTNATVSGNVASDEGALDLDGTATLTHVTVANNTGNGGGATGGVNVRGGTTTVGNVLIADNAGAGDQLTVGGGSLVASGQNLVEGGCSAGACSGFLTSDPQLEPLADNGGDSETHGLVFGSAAVDAGSNLGVSTDQRGFGRPQGSAPDLGALEFVFEAGVVVTPDGLVTPVERAPGTGYAQQFTVTNTAGTPETVDLVATIGSEIVPFITVDSLIGSGFGGAGTTTTTSAIPAGSSVPVNVFYTVAAGISGYTDTIRVLGTLTSDGSKTDTGFAEVVRGCGSPTITVGTMSELREAIADSCISTILIQPGTYQLPSSGSGAMVLNRDLVIGNAGGGEVTLDAGDVSRVFEIPSGVTVELSELQITGGYDPVDGGGIYNQGTLVMEDMLFYESGVGDDGAGFYNQGGNVTIVNSTFSENIAQDDGGAFETNGGSVSLLHVSLIGNQAGASVVETGGAFKVFGGATVTMTNSLVSDNITSGGNEPEPIDVDNGTVNLVGVNLIEGGCSGCSGATGAIIDAEPFLQPLANNGGTTRTHGLESNSPAIDVAVNQGVSDDQRGVSRDSEGTGYDVGAYERQVSLSISVTPDGLGTGNEVERFTGTSYSQDFVVSHSSGGNRDIDLIGSELGPVAGTSFLEVTAITGSGVTGAADSARIAGLADGEMRTITVTYDVLATGVDAQIDTLLLQGRLVDAPTVVDFGRAEVEWICEPGLTATVSTMAEMRAAVANACVEVIDVTPGSYSLTSSGSGAMVLDRDVTIRNTGGGEVLFDAGGSDRVFTVESGANVVMEGLSLTGGNSFGQDRNQRGGAIVVSGSLDFSGGTITGSTADDGSAIALAGGTLVLVNATISGNAATDRAALDLDGTATLTHVTVADNSAGGSGVPSGINVRGGSTAIANSVVADNSGGSTQLGVQGGSLSSSGQNLVEGGCSAGACSGFLTGDPGLLALANNGGDSRTHALNGGSIARDSGGALGVPVDQRGVARPQNGTPDLGAFEALPAATIDLTPDGLGTPNETTFGTGFFQDFDVTSGASVTEAVDLVVQSTPSFLTVDSIIASGATGSADSIRIASIAPAATVTARVWFSVAPGLADLTENLDLEASFVFDGSVMDTGFAEIRRSCGPATVTVSTMAELRDAVADPCVSTIRLNPGTYLLTASGSGPLVIDRDLDFENVGGGEVVFDGGMASRIFEIAAGTSVSMTEITINRGSTGGDGGGVLNEGALTLEQVTFSDNTAGDDGGALYVLSGSVDMVNVTFSANSATGDGGGLAAESGTVTVTHGSFVANTAGGSGSGIYTFGGTVELRNSLAAGGGVTVASGGGTLTTTGVNVFQGGCTGCTGATVTNADPLVDPLSNYGGTTKTHRLQMASPAIDAADPAYVPTTDQRGVVRAGEGSGGDVGAYERQASFAVDVVPDGGVNQPRQAGSGYTQDFTVTNGSVGAQDIDLLAEAFAPTGSTTFLAINSISGTGVSGAGDSARVAAVPSGGSVVVTVNYDVVAGDFAAQVDTLQLLARIVANPVTADPGRAEIVFECGASFGVTVSTMSELRDAVANACVTDIALNPGTYSLPSSGSGALVVDRDLNFTNAGFGEVILDAQNGSRVVEVAAGAAVSMDGLTLTGGTASGGLGGALLADGDVTFTSGTIRGNTAAQGGGIQVSSTGSLVMVNATVSGNSATTRGGAMNLAGTATLTHVTVAYNSSSGPTGGLNVAGGSVTIRNTLVGDNTQISGPQIIVQSGALIAGGVNLVEGGCAATACSGAVTSDPQLAALANNGGNSLTHRLLIGSPARDAGTNLGVTVDQRGDPRPRGGGFDIGAFEALAGYDVTVSALQPTASGLPNNLEPSYVGSYTVLNSGSAPTPFVLLANVDGTAVAIDSIRGVGLGYGARPDSAQTGVLSGGASATIDVYYRILDVPEGSTDPVELVATSTSSPSTTDSDETLVNVTRPVMSMTKIANVPSGSAVPGADVVYSIAASNVGSESAWSAVVLDSIPQELDFKVGSVTQTLPGGISATLEYLDASLNPVTPTSEAGGAPVGYDRTVRFLRWTLDAPLPFGEQASFGFTARIR